METHVIACPNRGCDGAVVRLDKTSYFKCRRCSGYFSRDSEDDLLQKVEIDLDRLKNDHYQVRATTSVPA